MLKIPSLWIIYPQKHSSESGTLYCSKVVRYVEDSIFVDNIPTETFLRVWDTLLFEGSKVC